LQHIQKFNHPNNPQTPSAPRLLLDLIRFHWAYPARWAQHPNSSPQSPATNAQQSPAYRHTSPEWISSPAQTCFFATHYVADGGVMVFVDLKKYGLDQTEIDFIETKVKAMD
jgi:hypothetical protein